MGWRQQSAREKFMRHFRCHSDNNNSKRVHKTSVTIRLIRCHEFFSFHFAARQTIVSIENPKNGNMKKKNGMRPVPKMVDI